MCKANRVSLLLFCSLSPFIEPIILNVYNVSYMSVYLSDQHKWFIVPSFFTYKRQKKTKTHYLWVWNMNASKLLRLPMRNWVHVHEGKSPDTFTIKDALCPLNRSLPLRHRWYAFVCSDLLICVSPASQIKNIWRLELRESVHTIVFTFICIFRAKVYFCYRLFFSLWHYWSVFETSSFWFYNLTKHEETKLNSITNMLLCCVWEGEWWVFFFHIRHCDLIE